MLKHTIVCVMLVAAAAVAWERPDSSGGVPVPIEEFSHLTWGDSLVWGLFPVNGTTTTYLMSFPHTIPYAKHGDTLDSLGWDTVHMVGRRLLSAGLTFQWGNHPVAWFCGRYGSPVISKLYWYSIADGDSGEVVIDTFSFKDGASIAYVANDSFNPWSFAVPGWIYCLPCSTTAFWRYALPMHIPPPQDTWFLGCFPGPGSTIADQMPWFAWSSSTTSQYRIQVSTSQNFNNNVTDQALSDTQYESTTSLANGTYYWRTATWSGNQGWTWGTNTHMFILHGGWQSLAAIPVAANSGSTMAYDKGSFGVGIRSIVALVGGWGRKYCYRYSLSQNTWDTLDTAPRAIEEGSSITTRTPVQDTMAPITMAAFGGETHNDAPYIYKYLNSAGHRWDPWDNDSPDSFYNSYFPGTVHSASSMVMGAGDTMYLTLGAYSGEAHSFYWVHGPGYGDGGGGQSVASVCGGTKAHAITSPDRIEIEYQLPISGRVRASLLDVLGRQVNRLDAGEQRAGTHRLSWCRDFEGRKLSAGAYFVLLDMGAEKARLKAVVR